MSALARMRYMLWYENINGDVWAPPNDGSLCDPPDGFTYQHSQFPRELTHTVIDGSGVVARGTSSYSSDLVLAMTRPSLLEMARSIIRYAWPAPRVGFDEAVLLASNLCERCMNAEAHRRGLTWGYRRGSAEWIRANTRCGACEGDAT